MSLNAHDIRRLLLHIFRTNERLEDRGEFRLSACIWGPPGIGKTELVETLGRERGWPVVHIAPAQFEEMGDLLGMPTVQDGRTVFQPPAWVPREEGPGILLLDDFNRADDRILRGLMPLWQRYELVSWRLPRRWHLVLTANPDDGDYSVTPLDDAMQNRMLHLHMQFDAEAWAEWATAQGLDARGIRFVLAFPGLATGRRTTPRSLVQFFQLVAAVPDWNRERRLVYQLALGCLDAETADRLVEFIRLGADRWPRPEAWFRESGNEIPLPPTDTTDAALRLDALNGWLHELFLWLRTHADQLDARACARLATLLTDARVPAGLRQAFALRLAQIDKPAIQQVLARPEVVPLLLGA